jgi:hypothetical protein
MHPETMVRRALIRLGLLMVLVVLMLSGCGKGGSDEPPLPLGSITPSPR